MISRYTVHVDWDIDHPDWAEECWPMHAGGQLGQAVESVDVTAEVVCHDQPVPVVLELHHAATAALRAGPARKPA